MNHVREDLIIKYIQNDLSVEEKMELYDLMLKDGGFRKRLKEELEFSRKLRDTNLTLDRNVKDRIYQEIRLRAVKENLARMDIGNLVTEKILRLFMPKICSPLFKMLKK
ncbi:MAG: hypothetical protein GX175_05115 [Halanaerobiaceae bacterium]|jgi:hypothetical protein|nr:hypothetical protein [Halanaerobiaceae bacterium]